MSTDHVPAMPAAAHTPQRDDVDGALLRTLSASLAWTIVLGVAMAQCLAADSASAWTSGAALVAWTIAAEFLLAVPGRAWVPLPVQLLLPLAVLCALLALLEPGPHRAARWTADATLEVAVLVAIVLTGGLSRLFHRRMPTTAPLRFPLTEGRWRVVEGESRLLNHHWSAPAQRAALDVVRIGRNGMSRHWSGSGRALAFFAYDARVCAPCDGTILQIHDGEDDTHSRNAPPAGNHVVIETADGTRIVLAHLRRGSVEVATGQAVRTGDAIGRVGNSGNSTEPHLHVHAQRDGAPVRLRFSGRRSAAPRGATFRARPPSP